MSLFFDSPFLDSRPWGKFVQFTKGEPSTVKILTVDPGQAFSLQKHSKREEFWYALSGSGTVEIGEEKIAITPGSKFFIPKETTHRITAGDEAVQMLEISIGEFDESDIVRLEDRYGRTNI